MNGSAINGVTGLQNGDVICFDQHQYEIHFPGSTVNDGGNLPPEPVLTEISDDARRRPLPDRPIDEGTRVVFAQSNAGYEPLDHRDFRAPSLVVRNGSIAGEVFPLPDDMQRWTLGSSREIDILITDEGVSSNCLLYTSPSPRDRG